MSKTLSALLGHLGTILMTVLAALTNTGVLHQGTTVTLVLDVVAGALIATHIVGEKGLNALLSWLDTRLHMTAVTTKAAAQNAQAAQQAANLVSGLHSVVSSVTSSSPASPPA